MANIAFSSGPTPVSSGFQTKQEIVYRALRERIMDGHLQPGQRLVIEDIAQTYGVSPIPVREALQLLQAERLIEMKPHIGAAVAPISAHAITEIFTLMECLELAALRLSVPFVTTKQITFLRALILEMDELRSDYEKWAAKNFAFHKSICSITEMPRILDMTVQVFTEWERMRRHLFRDTPTPDLDKAQEDHLTMVELLEQKDMEKLERLTRAHNLTALKSYLGIAESRSS